MQEYKIFVDGRSEEVQEKAFRLGYKWNVFSAQYACLDKPFLFMTHGGNIMYSDDYDFYIRQPYSSITVKDFLELPEPKPNFKPFQKVLVRDDDHGEWNAALYSHYDEGMKDFDRGPHIASATYWQQCIAFEGNEHLVGKTDSE